MREGLRRRRLLFLWLFSVCVERNSSVFVPYGCRKQNERCHLSVNNSSVLLMLARTSTEAVDSYCGRRGGINALDIYTLPTVNGSAAMFTSELISALLVLCVPVGRAACCLLPLAVDTNLSPAMGI